MVHRKAILLASKLVDNVQFTQIDPLLYLGGDSDMVHWKTIFLLHISDVPYLETCLEK